MPPTRVDTILHGGTVVSNDATTHQDVAIKDGRIVALGDAAIMPDARETIDVRGLIVLPGMIDAHAHFTFDDWTAGPRLSAFGGVTTSIVFLQGRGAPVDLVRQGMEEAGARSVVDFAFHVILQPVPEADPDELIDGIPEAAALGVRSFKIFMGYRRSGRNLVTDDFLYRAMKVMRSLGALPMVHAENADLIWALEQEQIAAGKVAPEHYPASRPIVAETEAIHRAAEIAKAAESPLYVVHLTTPQGLEIIKARMAQGQRVYTETCPQYLLLTEKEMTRWGPMAKIGPPMRTPAENDGLWRGLREGWIPIVASDHAAHDPVFKQPGWQNIFNDERGVSIPFGAPSAETLVPLMYSEGVVKRKLPLWWLARVLAENPARTFGLYPRKGVIAPGADADVTIIDPRARVELRGAELHSRTSFTPYEGWRLRGRPVLTMVRGRVLLKDGALHQQPGFGTYLPAGTWLPPVYGPVT